MTVRRQWCGGGSGVAVAVAVALMRQGRHGGVILSAPMVVAVVMMMVIIDGDGSGSDGAGDNCDGDCGDNCARRGVTAAVAVSVEAAWRSNTASLSSTVYMMPWQLGSLNTRTFVHCSVVEACPPTSHRVR